MTRLEQFQSHLLDDAELNEFVGGRIIVGSLRDTPWPAVAINWLNRPYNQQGVIVLDADEPSGPLMLQIDGWIEGIAPEPLEAAKQAKAGIQQLADILRRVIAEYDRDSCKILRDNVLCANQNGDKRRVSIEIELANKQALIGAGG